MKHIIILGDGMADHPIASLGGQTPMEHAATPFMDMLARQGRTGRLQTVPDGYAPGSEVANTAILGYDLDKVYEGRGPLEAASIGYDMGPDDMAIRCNIITIEDGRIRNHHGGHLTTDDGGQLIDFLQEKLGDERVRFIRGIQYRHLLVIKGGNKHIECAPPHDHPDEEAEPLMIRPSEVSGDMSCCEPAQHFSPNSTRLSPQQTADLLNTLIRRSQELLPQHPINQGRKPMANSIWPWSPGYRPAMPTLSQTYPQIESGSVISAVDLIRGIGRYAGLRSIEVEGATGLWNTNYEGKAQAAIDALRNEDFVFLHVEASDEAGHDGDTALKIRTIEALDSRIVQPIYETVSKWDEPVCIAILPDHPTPVELRTHVAEPVPFLVWHKGIEPDSVQTFSEASCVGGSYGLLRQQQFMQKLMEIEN